MKYALIFFLTFFVATSGSSQSNSKNTVESVAGKYVGYAESYIMGVVAGRDIVVPGITHTFIINAKNLVNLNQLSDKADKANYKGKYTLVELENGNILLKCKMTEITKSAYPSTPEYHITFSSDGTIVCIENPGSKIKTPSFSLSRQQ